MFFVLRMAWWFSGNDMAALLYARLGRENPSLEKIVPLGAYGLPLSSTKPMSTGLSIVFFQPINLPFALLYLCRQIVSFLS